MSRFWIRLCKLLAAAALVFLLGLVIWTFLRAARNAASPAADNASPAPAGATATPIPTMAPPVTATPAPTATPVPTPSPTPEPVRYVISLVGDCTLASYPDIRGWGVSFESVVGTDWDYPFSGTRELFGMLHFRSDGLGAHHVFVPGAVGGGGDPDPGRRGRGHHGQQSRHGLRSGGLRRHGCQSGPGGDRPHRRRRGDPSGHALRSHGGALRDLCLS